MRQYTVSGLMVVVCALFSVGCEGEEMPDVVMFWRGVGDDQGVYRGSLINSVPERGPYWEPQQHLPEAGTSDSPAVATFTPTMLSYRAPRPGEATELYAAWKGVEGDDRLYWTTKQETLPFREPLPFSSSFGPALAVRGSRDLFLAWRGTGDDQSIGWAHNDLNRDGWEHGGTIPKAGTSHKPALTYYHAFLYAAWKGIAGDSGIYVSQFGGAWRDQVRVPDVGTSQAPAIVGFKNALHMVWRGVDKDQGIYHSSSTDDGISSRDTGVTWTPQERIPDVGTNHSPAIAATETRLYIAWRGIEGDEAVYWSWSYDGSSWSEQQRVPDVGSRVGPALAIDDSDVPRGD